MKKRQNARTLEILEPFTFADGTVRDALVTWRLWDDPRTGSPRRRCLGVREIKRCACGRVYDAAGWAALELVGTLPAVEADDDAPAMPALEHRNCLCGSTLLIAVGSLEAKKS